MKRAGTTRPDAKRPPVGLVAADQAARTERALQLFVRAEVAMPWEREQIKRRAQQLAAQDVRESKTAS